MIANEIQKMHDALHAFQTALSDYVEIGQMGAQSASLRCDFGGFLPATSVIVTEPALLH
jgi:hypothetical protein